ncbi:MAG: type II secretion system F family protein [Xanthomarina sp.]
MAFNLDNIQAKKAVSKSENDSPSGSFLTKEITLFNKPFSNKMKEAFYIEMSVLLKAGVNLKEGLELIANSQKKKNTKEILQNVVEDIVSGKSLSDALKAFKQFSDYEYYSIKIGEETGTLSQVIEQLGAFYAKKNEQHRNLISALTYPIIILSTAVLVVVFMLQYVVPMFQDIFEQQKVELPTITKVIINVSAFMKSYSWLLLLIFIGLIASRAAFNQKIWYKKNKDKLILKLPFVGDFVKTVYMSQFTQAVTLLTASKVPVVNSIQLVKQMINFQPLKEALESVESEILKGHSLSESLSKQAIFDQKMIAMVKVAEETNQNEFIFERLNNQYSTQVDQSSKLLATIMEPVIILIIGVLVGVILIAMYLPMFKLSSVLG